MSSPDLYNTFEPISSREGAHQVLDTPWNDFLVRNFEGLDVQPLLDLLMQRLGTLTILDEGCGSSNTLFEAVEYLENGRIPGSLAAFGITASTDYLAKPAPEFLQEQVLRTSEGSDIDRKRLKLLMRGVILDSLYGYHRYSPASNLIRIKKADVHRLDAIFPNQTFDLIYSSNTYPHLVDPRLAFEQSCNALNNGGLLLIDSLPVQDLLPSYAEQLQAKNTGYKITTTLSDNPHYQSVALEKSTSLNLVS